MRYLFVVLLFLSGCEFPIPEPTEYAVVTITCYDIKGNVTVKRPHHTGPWTMVNDHTLGYWSHRCIVERENDGQN